MKHVSIQTDCDIVPLLGDESEANPKHAKKEHATVEDTWLAVCDTLDIPKGEKSPHHNLVVKRSGWKTIRVFVSSTFKDFMNEREVLVKEVRNLYSLQLLLLKLHANILHYCLHQNHENCR